MSNKTKKKQLKQVQNQAQEGRSMVEMLGVLAVIGVISLGGIAGYRMAMNRYQANQIANEINLMRTDAKIKVAQGAEELLLGEPYDDEKHLKFNANYGVAVEFEDIETETPGKTETGYSFALSGIPAGVCKPLATLLDGMDDTAVLEINGKDYETAENLCDNEENEVVVAFSTKDLGVSRGEKEACDEATCEGYCSAEGACKECPEDAPWNEATRQCKCSSNKHWNKEIEACAACSDNSHCTSSSKPICKAGVCDKCTADEECIESSKGEHCSSSGSCVTCGSSASAAAWNETARKCDTCKNVDPEKPNWTGSECVSECPTDKPISYNNQCVECRKNEDCDKKGDGNHYWCDTGANNGTCKQCFKWDESTQHCQRGECESNEDCDSDEFCLSTNCSYACSNSQMTEEDSCKNGTYYKCKKIDSYKAENKDTEHSDRYVMSKSSMNWWSAERFCKALGKRMVTISELGCKHKIQYSGGNCTTGFCHASDTEQACGTQNKREGESYYGDVSEVIKELRKAENGDETKGNHTYWLYDAFANTTSSRNSCFVYAVTLNAGNVGYGNLRNYDGTYYPYALCE